MNLPAGLPEADTLRVEEAKVRDYLLNFEHPEGGPKAKFFGQFGFTRREWRVLAEALRLHGRTQPVIRRTDTRHGRKYEVRCEMRTSDGRNPCVTSIWIKEGEGAPRLVTVRPPTSALIAADEGVFTRARQCSSQNAEKSGPRISRMSTDKTQSVSHSG